VTLRFSSARLSAFARAAGVVPYLCVFAMSICAYEAVAQEPEALPSAEAMIASPPRIWASKAGDGLGAPVELVSRSTSSASHDAAAADFGRAMPLASGRLTSRFGMRFDPLAGGHRMHSGIDLAAAEGTPVTAPQDGVVSFSNWSGGYGLLVAVEHPSGVQTRFGHLSRVAVRPGQQVRKGQVLGLVGSTGRSTGPHLHYEVRHRGRAIDPLALR
jgi:murein DD-endopeptidase MepM/ murein hydrolase activator NlpD